MTKAGYVAIVAAAAVVLAGCGGFPRNDPGKGLGQITVSSPRIEGRERLINDRREQELWLSGRLKDLDDAEFGVSGEVDLRSLAVTAVQASVSRDPNMKLDELNRARQAELLRQAADDERALGTFRAAQRDQILADARAGKITTDEVKDRLTKLGLNLATTSPSTAASAASATVTGVPTPPASQVSAKTDVNKVTPPADNARRSPIASTPIELFQDRLAAREIIRNERNDVRLDDLHDLAGNTLYRLTLNAEVLPEDDASAWAVARLRVKLPQLDAGAAGRLLALARAQFEVNLRHSVDATERLLLRRLNDVCWKQEVAALNLVSVGWHDKEHERAFRRAMRCATSDLGSRTRFSIERILAASALRGLEEVPVKAQPQTTTPWWEGRPARSQDLMLARQAATESAEEFRTRGRLLSRWSFWLDEVMKAYSKEQTEASILPCIDSGSACPSSIAGGTPDLRFHAMLKAAVSGSVYAVTPKETVQRLSEVASNRKLSEFLLNVAALTGGVGASTGLQNIRAYDAFYSALRRQPLVVGMTESGSMCSAAGCQNELVFGWVLGPSFQLSSDGKSTRYRHTVVQRSVSAELVLPAWLDKVVIERETFWVREDGTVVPAAACRAVGSSGCPGDVMEVSLPARPVEALEAVSGRQLREPRVDEFQYLDVVEKERASVLITGQNVWRSAEVLIGAQRAELITVLPDNGGIVATFGPIQPSYGASTSDSGRVPLTLVTSAGRVDAGRVTIRSERAEAATDAKKLEITGFVPRVVAAAEHGFELSQPLKPTESLMVRIGSKKDVNLRVILEKTTQLDDERKRVKFSVPAASVPNLKTGNSILVDALVTRPSGGIEVFNVVKSGTYYEKDADLEASATATRAKPTDPIVVKLQLPPGSVDGFQSLAKGNARVVGTIEWPGQAEKLTLESDCPILAAAPNACAAPLAASGAAKDALAKVKNADLKLSVSLKGSDNPRLKQDAVVVKP